MRGMMRLTSEHDTMTATTNCSEYFSGLMLVEVSSCPRWLNWICKRIRNLLED